jgi:hypothetical protein
MTVSSLALAALLCPAKVNGISGRGPALTPGSTIAVTVPRLRGGGETA